MTRRAAPLVPLLLLAAAVAYLATSVVHLMASGVAYRDEVRGTTRPVDVAVASIQTQQFHWGVHTMVAVACVALCLVATLVTWVVAGRREDRP